MVELLLEREGDVGVLADGMGALVSGVGGFVVVSGAAGVGKTRLLERARVLAGERGVRVLRARGSALEREYPFGLVRQLFEPLLLAAPAGQREAWLSGAAVSAGAALGLEVPAGVGKGEFAVLHGLFWLTSNVCLDGPVLLAVDDLHWADEPSLRFLAFLQPRLEDLRVEVVAAMRPAEPGAAQRLLDGIADDDSSQLLYPAPLSAQGTSALLEEVFQEPAESGFAAACHAATGGNPLWVTELALRLAAEGVRPVAAAAAVVKRVGPQAVARRVGLELGRLAEGPVRLAEAVAVLGGRATVADAGRLARQGTADAAAGIGQLERTRLLYAGGDGEWGIREFEYVHPLVQAAVLDGMPMSRRVALHMEAVRLLVDSGADPDRVSAHLLQLPPGAAPQAETVGVLRRAAASALTRGAPEAAHAYLQRCLHERLEDSERLAVLTEAMTAAQRVDAAAAVEHFDAAIALAPDPVTRARLTAAIGITHTLLGRADTTVTVLTRAIDELPADEDDLRRTLEANLMLMPVASAGLAGLLQRLDRLRGLPPTGGLGALLLDGAVAVMELYAGDPRAVGRARRVLADDRIFEAVSRGTTVAAVSGFGVLNISSPGEGVGAYDQVIARARRDGSVAALPLLLWQRGVRWLGCGSLEEAESDFREALQLSERTHFDVARISVNPPLAQVLLAQGRAGEAAACLERTGIPDVLPRSGWFWFYLQARSEVLLAQDRPDEALQSALAAGQRLEAHFTAAGGCNPAIVAWRSQAALCLHTLGKDADARDHAAEELRVARRYGAPHAIGHALRVAGQVTPGPDGLDLLRQAATTLQPTPARLEHAHALIALGTALRRANAPTQARPHLAQGLETAHRCGAANLTDHARTELRIAGARPRRTHLTGPEALTASEHRVAELAAQGHTNRQIAQQLYVTAKTVEVHLSSTYRKLGITHRQDIPHHLPQNA